MISNKYLFSVLRNNNSALYIKQLRHIGAINVNAKEESVADSEWDRAKPFSQVPQPSKLGLLKKFLPGGALKNETLPGIYAHFRKEYGDIFMVPGLFGKPNMVSTFNPNDIERVYRTEGVYPVRRGMDVLSYYRKVYRPELFKYSTGLLTEQGKEWGHFRSTVNPAMISPKTTRLYAPRMNKVTDDLLERIRRIRDKDTNQMPALFVDELKYWAFNSISLVALDVDLDLINNRDANPLVKEFIDGLQEFFELLLLLEFKPSIWKYYATSDFKKIMNRMDIMTEIATTYIDQTLHRLDREKAQGIPPKPEDDQSILERLININRSVAVVNSMDMMLGGVDTTISALAGCLLCLAKNPEKQQKLREEILQILPHKTSPITPQSLKTLPYLRACLKESLRLYPVAPGNFRTTGQEVVLSGYQVPKGTDVIMIAQLMLRDPKYFKRPEEFVPERWLRGEESLSDGCPLNQNSTFVFLPFGFGARTCIGKRLVNLELEIGVAKMIRNFDIRFEHSTENIFRSQMINVPNKPLQFTMTEISE